MENKLQSPNIDILIHSGLLLSPFGPFTIVFCNIVESSDLNDLDLLQRLVSVLAVSSTSLRLIAFKPQARIFQALYDVAARYVEVKSDFAMRDILGDSTVGLDLNMCLGEIAGLGSDLVLSPSCPITYEDEPTPQSMDVATLLPGDSYWVRLLGEMTAL
jgi:hypothetical protein